MAWEQCERPSSPGDETRERREDFETPTHEIDEASTAIRPDAVSVDHHTAFTLGPVREADTSDGLVEWVWRARHENRVVYLARENEARDGWEAESVLFAYDGPELIELDVSADQSGRFVVCAARPTGPEGASEVWIFSYDPVGAAYEFRVYGPGRTPRALLDSPLDVVGSDVVVFYVSDEADGMVYRQQRDRYAIEYPTPIVGAEGLAVEDAVRLRSRRVHVIMSRRDAEHGTYSLETISTALPGFRITDRFEVSGEVVSALVEKVFSWLDGHIEAERFEVSGEVVSALVREAFDWIIHGTETERFEVSGEVVSVAVVAAFEWIVVSVEPDRFEVSGEVVSALVEKMFDWIIHGMEAERFKVSGEVVSAQVLEAA